MLFRSLEPGLATTVTPAGTTLVLTTAEIAKTSFVRTRPFQATPDTGTALVTPTVWNTTGDFSKRWLTQVGSQTHSMAYKVGDLTPGVRYRLNITRAGATVTANYTADSTGTITFTDSAVTTGVTEYVVMF